MTYLPIPGDLYTQHIWPALLHDLPLHQGRADFRRTCLSCEACEASSSPSSRGIAALPCPGNTKLPRAGLLAHSLPWHLKHGPQQASHTAWTGKKRTLPSALPCLIFKAWYTSLEIG